MRRRLVRPFGCCLRRWPSFGERACMLLCSDADAAMWTVGLRMIVAELARKPLSPVRCANNAPM